MSRTRDAIHPGPDGLGTFLGWRVFRANDGKPIVYRDYKNPWDQFGYRAYPKGAWVLHMMRGIVGEEIGLPSPRQMVDLQLATRTTIGDLEEIDWSVGYRAPQSAVDLRPSGALAALRWLDFDLDRKTVIGQTTGFALGWGVAAAQGVKIAQPDRQVACLVGDDARHLGPLLRRQAPDFAGMAVGHETANTVMTGQPLGELPQFGLVNGVVGTERHLHRR